jgi:hypothetical protein
VVLGAQARRDVLDLLLGRLEADGAQDVTEHLAGLSHLALRDQVARRLGHSQREDAVDESRDQPDEEHPTPGVLAEPQLGVRAAGDPGEEGVAQQRHEDAAHDGELLQGSEPAMDVGRRDLGDVCRCDHRRHPDPQPADEAPEDEIPHTEGETGAEGADGEHGRRDQHRPDTPEPVGDRSGIPGADRRAEQRARDREAREGRAELEVCRDRVDGTVDDGGVETEEEAADRGDGGDQDRLRRGLLVLVDVGHRPSSTRWRE